MDLLRNNETKIHLQDLKPHGWVDIVFRKDILSFLFEARIFYFRLSIQSQYIILCNTTSCHKAVFFYFSLEMFSLLSCFILYVKNGRSRKYDVSPF